MTTTYATGTIRADLGQKGQAKSGSAAVHQKISTSHTLEHAGLLAN